MLDETFGGIFVAVASWLWIAITGLLLVAPFAWQRGRGGSFEPFTPATFPVWTYLAPVFVVGSALLVAGLAKQPMPEGLIPEPEERYYAFAIAYVAIGWFCFLVGYYWRGGVAAGDWGQRRLPDANWAPGEIRLPALVPLSLGIACYGIALQAGLIGYQRPEIVGRFDALLIYAAWLAQLAAFMLWASLFARTPWTRTERLLATGLVLLGPLYLVASASRAGLLTYLLIVAVAYRFAGRTITRWSVVAFIGLAAFSLGAGTVWSTTYRLVKGNEAPMIAATATPPGNQSPTEDPPEAPAQDDSRRTAADLIVETARETAQRDAVGTVRFGLRSVAQRIEIASSVAVVVANYQRLRPEEERHGIADNIWRDTWTAVIPRALWPDKPKVSDARTYSLIYFRYGESSFAMTPMGDLLRNFGPAGIGLGMALLGLGLRVLYRALIEAQPLRIPRAAVFVAVLMSVSYEGFYGAILPVTMRVAAIATFGVLAVHLGVLVQRRARTGRLIDP